MAGAAPSSLPIRTPCLACHSLRLLGLITQGLPCATALLKESLANPIDEDVEEELRALEEDDNGGFEPATDVTSETHGGGAFLTITMEPTETVNCDRGWTL